MIFFFASAGASAAYLTVSEIFPMETRAMAISFFYAVGTAIGGITGPLLFGRLIEAGGETNVMYGYLLGAALMIAAGVVEIVLGVEAAQKQLEDIAKPLTAEDAEAARATSDLDEDEGRGRGAGRAAGASYGLVAVPVQLERRRRARTTSTSTRELDMLERAVRDKGELRAARARAARRLQVLGPGRFGRALRAGVRQGRLSAAAARASTARRLGASSRRDGSFRQATRLREVSAVGRG